MVTGAGDDYPTCKKCYVTLRLYHEDLRPDRISDALDLRPTDTQVKGRPLTTSGGRVVTPLIGGWFLSSHGAIGSRDLRRHLEWLLGGLAGRDDVLGQLRADGYRMDVFC